MCPQIFVLMMICKFNHVNCNFGTNSCHDSETDSTTPSYALEYEHGVGMEETGNETNGPSELASSNNEEESNVDSDLLEKPNTLPDPHPFTNCDYILTDYHPHSGREYTTHTLSDYGSQQSSKIPPNKEPWRPFCTHLNFEICELALESYLNRTQIKKLITLINKAVLAGPDNQHDGFTIRSVDEVEKLWELTTKQHVQVCYIYNLSFFNQC